MAGREGFSDLLLGPVLREHVIEGRLQSLAAQSGADEIRILGCRVGAKFKFIIDYAQTCIVSVDAVHATADRQAV